MQSIARERGYAGRNQEGYLFEDYKKFNDDFFKGFVDLNSNDFFSFLEESRGEVDEDGDVLMVPRVLDIRWANVKKALLTQLAILPDVTAKLQSMPLYHPIYVKMAAEVGDVEMV